MPLNRIRPIWLLSYGMLLLCIAPLVTFSLLQVLLSSDVSGATSEAILSGCVSLLVLAGLALLVLGAYRLHLDSRRMVAFIATAEILLACHYFAWVQGIVADFSAGAALWLLMLGPLAVIGMVTLVRNATRRDNPLWTAGGIVLWAAQAAAIGYLYWMLSGV